MSEEKDLKPCPFCGGLEIYDTSRETYSFWLFCKDCGAYGPVGKNYENAVKLWNDRRRKR